MSDSGEIGHAVPLYTTVELPREDWVEGRKQYVGASDVAKVLGLHPRGGPLSVYLAKTEGEPGLPESAMASVRRGIRREPLILADASDALSVELGAEVPVVAHPYVLRHPDVEALACNLDGVALLPDRSAVVEAKWQGSWARRGWESFVADGAPPEGSFLECHFVQVQAQLAVTGLDHGYLAGDCDANFYLIRVERDEALIGIITEQIGAFWEKHVSKRVPPPADARDADAIRKVYRESVVGKSVDLTPLAADVELLRELRTKKREIEVEMKEIRAQLLATMTDCELGTLPDGTVVKMTNVRRNHFDSKAFQEAHPELHKQFSRVITTRQLRP